MKYIGIIPARYASTRLEGKPLVDILGKTMIRRVYEQATQVMNEVWVATDDIRIKEEVEGFGGNAILTSSSHTNGTSRCYEAVAELHRIQDCRYDVVINIQGDEPMLEPSQLTELMKCFSDENVDFATLAHPVKDGNLLNSDSNVFLVKDVHDNALYFSRAVIPVMRDIPKEEWINHHTYYKHIGLYGYRTNALLKFVNMRSSSLEESEKLEQNRWIENGGKIRVGFSDKLSISVDTQEDLSKVRSLIKG